MSSISIDVIRADSSAVDAQLLLGLKGDKGDQGDTGASAGFGTVTASVDANVGTPSVTVTASGTDTAKNFDFAFHNLKGADGVCDVNDVKVLNKLYGTDTESYTSQLSSGDAFLSNADFGTLGYVEATSSGSGAFTVSDTTSLRLSDGGIILVKFGADSSNGSTLNIHSADVAYTGNIPIYVNGSAISSGDIKAGDVVALSYDSGNNRWHVIGKSYPRFTASRDGIVPAAGNVSETGEWRLLSNEGWLTVGVVAEYDSPKIPWARKYSAELSGVPTAPTASASTDNTQIATTAFVHDVVDSMTSGVSDVTVDGASIVSSGVADIPIMQGATALANGRAGLVPIAEAGEQDRFLGGDGTFHELGLSVYGSDIELGVDGMETISSVTLADVAMSGDYDDLSNKPTKVSDLENDVPFVDINQLYSILPTDTASGDIASFTDGADNVPMRSVKAQIEPIQDLHGYDKPWSGGAGVNILDPSKKTTYNGADGLRWYEADGITLKANQAYTFKYYPASGESMALYIVNKAGGSYLINGSVSITYTPTEDVVVYLQAYRSNISTDDTRYLFTKGSTAPTQWTPYSNICPIYGHTEEVVEQRGKNLLENRGTSGSSNGIDWTVNADGSVSLHGTATSEVGISVNSSSNKKQIGRGSMQLACSALSSYNPQISGINFQSDIYADGVYVNTLQNSTKTYSYSGSVIEVGMSRLRIASGTVVPIGTVYYPQIELGSTATSYEPYQGDTYTTQFGQTVYGGSVDLVSGVLTVDRAYGEYDGSADEEWVMHGSGSASAYAMRIGISNFKFIPSVVTAWTNYLPSIDNGKTWGNYDAFISMGATGIITGIRTITTVEDWRAYLAEHPLQVVYELATPTTIQLTPQEIDSFKATNNLWASTGEIEVEYRADIGLYVNKVLS